MVIRTIQDIERAGLMMRVWCLWCARGELVKPGLWVRWARHGRTIDLIEARRFFRCTVCRSNLYVLLLPARWPPAPAAATPRSPERARLWEAEVAAFFHGNRAAQKRRTIVGEDRLHRAIIESCRRDRGSTDP